MTVPRAGLVAEQVDPHWFFPHAGKGAAIVVEGFADAGIAVFPRYVGAIHLYEVYDTVATNLVLALVRTAIARLQVAVVALLIESRVHDVVAAAPRLAVGATSGVGQV